MGLSKAEKAKLAKEKKEAEAKKKAEFEATRKKQSEEGKAKQAKLLETAVEVTNTVGSRKVNLKSGGDFLILPGKTLIQPKIWEEIKDSKEGKMLIEAQILSSNEE